MENKHPNIFKFFKDKLYIISTYGFLGVAFVSSDLWMPYLKDFMNKNEEQMLSRALKPLEVKIYNMETMMINCRGGVKALHADEIIRIVRNAATLKAQRIREGLILILNTHKVDTKSQQRRFRKKIKTLMKKNRKIYFDDVSKYQHRGIGKVTDYLDKNFPRKKYLDAIVRSVIENDCEEGTNREIAIDSYSYMVDIQDSFLNQMYKDMKAKE